MRARPVRGRDLTPSTKHTHRWLKQSRWMTTQGWPDERCLVSQDMDIVPKAAKPEP